MDALNVSSYILIKFLIEGIFIVLMNGRIGSLRDLSSIYYCLSWVHLNKWWRRAYTLGNRAQRLLVKLDRIEDLHDQVLPLVVVRLWLSLLEIKTRIIGRDDTNWAKVWHWYLISRVEIHRLGHLVMNWNLLFNILENIFLSSLIISIHHLGAWNIHLLISIKHQIWIIILMNKLRLLN